MRIRSGSETLPIRSITHVWWYISGPDAAVLLHAEAADGWDGEPQGAEGVPHLRQDPLRQVHMEQAHANTQRYVALKVQSRAVDSHSLYADPDP